MALSQTKNLGALADHFQRKPAAILTKAKGPGLSIKRMAKWTYDEPASQRRILQDKADALDRAEVVVSGVVPL